MRSPLPIITSSAIAFTQWVMRTTRWWRRLTLSMAARSESGRAGSRPRCEPGTRRAQPVVCFFPISPFFLSMSPLSMSPFFFLPFFISPPLSPISSFFISSPAWAMVHDDGRATASITTNTRTSFMVCLLGLGFGSSSGSWGQLERRRRRRCHGWSPTGRRPPARRPARRRSSGLLSVMRTASRAVGGSGSRSDSARTIRASWSSSPPFSPRRTRVRDDACVSATTTRQSRASGRRARGRTCTSTTTRSPSIAAVPASAWTSGGAVAAHRILGAARSSSVTRRNAPCRRRSSAACTDRRHRAGRRAIAGPRSRRTTVAGR